MAPMKFIHVLLAALPLPFLGFIATLVSLLHDRSVLLIKHLPTTEVEASIVFAGIGAVVSLMVAILIAAAIAVFLGRSDGEADEAPEYGLAA